MVRVVTAQTQSVGDHKILPRREDGSRPVDRRFGTCSILLGHLRPEDKDLDEETTSPRSQRHR